MRALDDLRGIDARGYALLVARGKRAIHDLHPRTRAHALERHVRKLLARVLQHEILALVLRRERRVAAFAAERDPAVVGRNQSRHAEPGARPEQPDHAVLAARAAADLHALCVGEARQRHRERGEVVYDEQRVEAERATRCLDREAPVVVRHRDLVAVDRVRDRDRRMIHARDLHVLQILADRVGERRIVGAGVHADLRDLARAGFQREARVGAADVREQARAVGVLARDDGLTLRTSRHRAWSPCRWPVGKSHSSAARPLRRRARCAWPRLRSAGTGGRRV